MKRKRPSIRAAFALLIVAVAAPHLAAERFRFRYETGARYRIVSRVDEKVYINDEFSHRADILNRIAVSVVEARDGTGTLEVVFQTSERAFGRTDVYEWSEEYESRYVRDAWGVYEIGEEYFMPVVRNVPRFPDRDIAPGESWTAPGEEVHDFRANFGVSNAYRFPIEVSYTYLGRDRLDGTMYDKISIRYTVFHKAAPQPGVSLYPVRIFGYSDQILYWDNLAGRPYHYSEEFDFFFTLSSGDTVEYIGTAEATVIESTGMAKADLADEIREELDRSAVEDTEVSVSDEGVVLSLQNIQFLPDSSILQDSEKDKLQIVAEILKRYPERDILIVGHTALAGTAAGRQYLSEKRARAVGNYLLELRARREEQIVTRGMGAREPIADNSTEEGRRKNRRVEITILEN